MVINPRSRPLKLFFNEAVISRLPPNHPKIPLIEEDIGRRESGYRGELALDSFLEQLPDKGYYLFHGLRLSLGGLHFQIDTLIITPNYILAIEVKYMKGEITFDEIGDQMVQSSDDKQKGYDDAVLQAQFQSYQLRKWLKKHNFPSVPIEYLVAMTNSNSILRIKANSEASNRVCRIRRVLFKIEEFNKRYRDERLDQGTLRKLCRLLLKSHVEPTYDTEKTFKISKSEIKPGVHCLKCGYLGMKYKGCSWHCPKCGAKSKDAHIPALNHYYLIHGPTITNKQFREFFGIDRADFAYRMLKKLNLKYSGTNKHRIYYLFFRY